MKGLVIINGYPSGEKFLRQGQRIAEALTELGVPTDVKKNGEVFALLREDGGVESNVFGRYDFAVYLDKDKYLGGLLEAGGLRLFNSAKSVEDCDDKLRTYQVLSGAGVRLAATIPAPLCYTKDVEPSETFLKNVAQALGVPFVAKKSYGSFGEGVQLVRGYEELKQIEKAWLHIPHFYQRYISASCGRDIRVLVVGGRVVAAMERVAQGGEFRSNIELGGQGKRIALSSIYKETAERVAKYLHLDYCGVDLLEAEDGPVVCEVNSNAFFEGLESVTGINIPHLYAEYIISEMQTEKK